MKKVIKILIFPFALLFGILYFFSGGYKPNIPTDVADVEDTEYPAGTEFNPPIFSLGFVSGHTEQDERGYSYEMNPLHVGDLVLSSGKIVIGEPFFFFDKEPLETVIKPGIYPVYIAEAIIREKNKVVDKRNALAKIELSSSTAVTWKYIESFPVDGGTGGFMDYQSVKDIIATNHFDDFTHRVIDGFDKVYKTPEPFNEQHPLYHQYVNLDYKNGNLIAFSTGWGDGFYNSFIGYDSDGNAVEILTDLGVIWWEPKEHLTNQRRPIKNPRAVF